MKQTVSLGITVAVLLTGITFPLFGQYQPDSSTDGTASDYLELTPAVPGYVTVNTDHWIGVFRASGKGTSTNPVEFDEGSEPDTTYLLDDSTFFPGDGHSTTSSGGSSETAFGYFRDGYLRYSVLYRSGREFEIQVSAAETPDSLITVGVRALNESGNAVGDIGYVVADVGWPVTLNDTDKTIISGIGGRVDDTRDDFVANDGINDYFEAYTGTDAENDGANIQYDVTSYSGSVEDIQVIYTISPQ